VWDEVTIQPSGIADYGDAPMKSWRLMPARWMRGLWRARAPNPLLAYDHDGREIRAMSLRNMRKHGVLCRVPC
jgi:hypothetical protein